MVLTPQLLQAIKLLQMPNAELAAFIESELERNPLLERADDLAAVAGRRGRRPTRRRPPSSPATGPAELETDPARWPKISAPRSTTPSIPTAPRRRPSARPTRATAFPRPRGRGSRAADGKPSRPTSRPMSPRRVSLGEHLTRQAMIVLTDPAERMIAPRPDRRARRGRLSDRRARGNRRPPRRAARPGRSGARAPAELEPTGVFARDLAECLALQLIERDRFDPAMQALIENLPALAKRDMAAVAPRLRRRRRGPLRHDRRDQAPRSQARPRLRRGVEPPAIPDVFVTAAPDNSWRVELNSEALPRVLVNETYAARIKRGAAREEDRQYISTQFADANWLTKSLEQRARTILNVASEIVRRQDGFLVEGVSACGRSTSRRSPMRSGFTNRPSRARPRTSSSRRRAACSR